MIRHANEFDAPAINPVPAGVVRPRWSVMIPTFNCARYLRSTLESVLIQDPGADEMQIEVIDDCSTQDDPEAVVAEVGCGRVAFYRQPKNGGATKNFNTCIERSSGHLVHILHGDDYVLPGFYQHLAAAVDHNPEIALFATRTYWVDESNIVSYVSARIPSLESGGKSANEFYYGTPITCPSTVIRRSFYERYGGFLPSLVHAADNEMWSRAAGLGGALVSAQVLACYRNFASNDTGRLVRNGENLRDVQRLNELLAVRHADFDAEFARRLICERAYNQARRFEQLGDREAASANWHYWKENAPFKLRARKFAGRLARRFFGLV